MNIFYEILFFKRKVFPPSHRQCSIVLGSWRAGIRCYHSAFSGQMELLSRQLSPFICPPLVVAELDTLSLNPSVYFWVVGIIFLLEAQCWWFVYFTHFHRFLNKLVRYPWWLYYTYYIYVLVLFLNLFWLVYVVCMRICGFDHLYMWGEAGGSHQGSSLITHYMF